MSDISAVVTCLRCGADLQVVTIGKIICGREGSAILQCTECAWQWHLHVTLAPVMDVIDTTPTSHRRVAVCGTEPGHAKHRREGSPICDDCRHAHAEAQARRQSGHRRESVSA